MSDTELHEILLKAEEQTLSDVSTCGNGQVEYQVEQPQRRDDVQTFCYALLPAMASQ